MDGNPNRGTPGQRWGGTVYAGARAPEALKVLVHRGDSQIDMRTATGAYLLVKSPGGFESQWACEIAPGPVPPAPTPCELTVIHPFQSGDVDVPGRYCVVAVVAVPGGAVRADPVELKVEQQFGPSCPDSNQQQH